LSLASHLFPSTPLCRSRLLELGLISEAGQTASRGGRKRVLLKLREEACLAIGIEISRQHVFGVLANLNGKVVSRDEEVTEPGEGDRKSTRLNSSHVKIA